MSFGGQAHHHRFYNQPISRVNQISEKSIHSRYQSQLPKQSINVEESMVSMKESYLKHINSPNVLKRDEIGYESVKFNKDIVDRFACDFIRDNQILEKFRREAEQMKRKKKYQHINTKQKYQLLPVLHSQPVQNMLKNESNYKIDKTENKFQPVQYQQSQIKSHIKQINFDNQNEQMNNVELQLCDVGINAKLDQQNRSSLKKKKQIQKKLIHQKKQKQKFKKKYQDLKYKIIKSKTRQSRGRKTTFQTHQEEQMLQSNHFQKQLNSLSGLIKDMSLQLHHNNQILKQNFNGANSLKVYSANKKQSAYQSYVSKNPEQSFYKELQKIPEKQNLEKQQTVFSIQKIKKKSLYQNFKTSKVSRFHTQLPQPVIQQKKSTQQICFPKIVYTGNTKVKFDGLRLLKQKLQQIRPHSLSSFNSKRSKTEYC